MHTEVAEAVRPIQAEVPTAGLQEALHIIDPEAEPLDTEVQVVALQDIGALVADLPVQGVPDIGAPEVEAAPEVQAIAEVLEVVQEDPVFEALVVLPDLPVEDLQEEAEVAEEGNNHPNIITP